MKTGRECASSLFPGSNLVRMRKGIYMNKLALFSILAGTLCAQRITDTKTADIRGGGGDGKCTIEVDVDDVAEVEISGNRAQIRTLSGGPASIRRFECNQEMPNNPNEFRFKGIDGRGRQSLVRNPGRGAAVIRIEDSKGGREGYTFDIFWRGGSGFGGGNDPGFGNGNRNRDRDRNGNGSVFGNGDGPVFGNGNGNGNWNREINYRGRGDGYFRQDNGSNLRLYNCRVSINRRGNIEVGFDSDRSNRITFTGRVQRLDGDLIYADMNGNNIGGVMEIDTDGRNRVRNISMRQNGGRDRYELSWHD